jgi:hypothetical protein
MKIFIIRDSQLSGAQFGKSIEAFVKATGKKPEQLQIITKQEGGLPFEAYSAADLMEAANGAIWKYKTGVITTEAEFCAAMNTAMSTSLELEVFRACWNSMCVVSEETLAMLKKLAVLQKKDSFHVHVIASSNPMHQQFIAEQFIMAGVELDRSYTRSYEKGTLAPAELLLEARKSFKESDEVVDLRGEKGPLLEMVEKRMQFSDSVDALLFSQASSSPQVTIAAASLGADVPVDLGALPIVSTVNVMNKLKL